MTVRLRLGLAIGLVVLATVAAVELVYYGDAFEPGAAGSELAPLLAERAFHALLVGIAAGAVSAALAPWLLGTRILRPLTSMVELARRLAEEGDFSRRLPVDAREGEVAQLVTTFNDLLAHIDRVLTAQRQLLADTSHELRTPLTTLRGNLDLLAYQDALPADERVQILVESRAEIDRMSRLVRDLLLLAESGQAAALARVPVRLDLLARSVADNVAGQDTPRILVDAGPTMVLGDADRLQQLLLNLLENALRHASTAPGAVRVGMRRQPPYILLEVVDDGPGIPPEALSRIFDRFYRVDRGRSRARGGSGLGLAIVRHIAEAHGGRVWAENVSDNPRHGARLSVLLPVEPSWAASDEAAAAPTAV